MKKFITFLLLSFSLFAGEAYIGIGANELDINDETLRCRLGVSAIVEYEATDYVAIETRVTMDLRGTYNAYQAYVKPSIGSVYGLVGIGRQVHGNEFHNGSIIGAGYQINESFFVDVTYWNETRIPILTVGIVKRF